ncbi:MAG: signal peptidase I [Lachnospiraceae bacterium]|nr:signal peptidase I [Lachnospiraceae bacterium]
MKKYLLRIIDVLSIGILAVSLMILLTVVFTKQGSTPSLFGCSVLRVMSGSMEPEIPTNSVIVVRRTDTDSLKVGDVISYYSDDPSLQGMVNTHRITDIETDDGKRLFTTKGDANATADLYPVKEEKIVGVVIWQSYLLGQTVRLLSNPLIFLPLIILPLAVILIAGIVRSVRITKQMMAQEEREAAAAALAKIREIREAQAQQNAQAEMPEEQVSLEHETRLYASEEALTVIEGKEAPPEIIGQTMSEEPGTKMLTPQAASATDAVITDHIGDKAAELKEMARLLEESLRTMQGDLNSKTEGQEENGGTTSD